MKNINQLSLCILLGISLYRAWGIDFVGDDLIQYFSSTCPSQGEFTRQALNDSRSLIRIIENIKNDQDCGLVSGSLEQLSKMEGLLAKLESQEQLNIELAKLSAQESELLLQLSKITNNDVQLEVSSILRDIQNQKASLSAQVGLINGFMPTDVEDIYFNTVQSANRVFEQVSRNSRCLEKNTNLLPAMTSLVGSVASAATVVNPALSLGLTAASDFLGHTFETLRRGRYNRLIRRISDSSLALEGYKCVLESLSKRWCDLEDAQNFLDFQANLRRQTNEESDLLSVVRLFDRDIPILIDWLNTVRTGVPAATTSDAERQEEIFFREAITRSAAAKGNGVVSQFRPLFELPGQTMQEKYGVIRSVVIALSGISCSGNFTSFDNNPLYDIYPIRFAPYYLLGLSEIVRENGQPVSFCNFDPFTQWPSGAGAYTPDLNAVKLRYESWVERAQNLVNRELTLVLQPDALQVLTAAFEDTNQKWKQSTIASLDNIIDFLLNHRPSRLRSDAFSMIYESTTNSLVKISNTIKDTIIKETALLESKDALEEIFKEAKLEYGVIVIQSRLEMIVRVSLKEYIDQNSTNEQFKPIAAQLLAAESFLDALSRINGTDNLALIAADINRARSLAIGNMNSFLSVFEKNINRILKKNHQLLGDDESLNEVYRRNIAEICLLLSDMPTWPKRIDKKHCLGSSLLAVVPNGPSSPVLTHKHLEQSFRKRGCAYRNYLRNSKIFEDWGVSL